MATENRYRRVDIARRDGEIDVDATLHRIPDLAMPSKPRPFPEQAPQDRSGKQGFSKRFMLVTFALGAMYSVTPAIPRVLESYDPPAKTYLAPVQRAALYPDATDGDYVLIGSSSPRNANIHLQTLDSLGFPVATEMRFKDGKMLKRVMISYESPEQLDSIVDRLEQYGHDERPVLLTKLHGKDKSWRQYVRPVDCDTLTISCIENASSIASLPYYDEVRSAAQELAADPALRAKGLDEHLAKKIIYTQMVIESNGRSHLVSDKGAVGLLQVLPTTAMEANGYDAPKGWRARREFIDGIHDRLLDPAYNIDTMKNVSRGYLGIALDHTGADNVEDALDAYLAAYNAGPGNMRSGKWRRFKETRGYIRKGKEVFKALTEKFG